MTVHFYLWTGSSPAASAFAPGVVVKVWRPNVDGFPPARFRSVANLVWWVLARIGAFSNPRFAAIQIERRGRVLHQLIVTPRWYRFPFMGANELQIGAVWTSPDARRQQLALSAVREAHRLCGSAGTRFWYVTDAGNTASGGLAKACGYRLVATGRRTRPLGLSALGRFVIDGPVQREVTATQAIDPDCDEESGAGRTLSVSH